MAGLTPITAGAFARAMDELLDERITRMYAEVADALDPDLCPTALLPWLAWSLGLTYWRSDWPESTQRLVIREARLILRERGRRQGVERQLGTLGAAVQITEWWEEAPPGTPGTWKVLVTPFLGAETDIAAQNEIAAALRRTAPLSRPWTITVGVYGVAPTFVMSHWRVVARTHLTTQTTI